MSLSKTSASRYCLHMAMAEDWDIKSQTKTNLLAVNSHEISSDSKKKLSSANSRWPFIGLSIVY